VDRVFGPQGREGVAFEGQFADQVSQCPVVAVAAGDQAEGGAGAGGFFVPAGVQLAGVGVEEQQPGQVGTIGWAARSSEVVMSGQQRVGKAVPGQDFGMAAHDNRGDVGHRVDQTHRAWTGGVRSCGAPPLVPFRFRQVMQMGAFVVAEAQAVNVAYL
jgi:hypothetical protein